MTSLDSAAPLNADLTQRVVVDTSRMDWAPSPSPGVFRKRLHRVGSAEAGQVTSIVRYQPDSKFPEHEHPEGEEILVLEGVFSDEHGDWPAGTYLLNPEGFRHAPFSREGCLIFVKLRQAPGVERRHVALSTDELAWTPSERPGIERRALHVQPEFDDATYLERWVPGTEPGEVLHSEGAEIFVLDGEFADERGTYAPGAWLRFPVCSRHQPRTRAGCTLYVKYGGISGLRSASERGSGRT